jgi:two-component system phosphate regulon response regulator PhoB
VGATAKTVLVVDDESAIRLLCRVNLELEGYRVLEAATLVDARRQLEAEDVDVLLLDVHVGSDDGCELLRELSDGESPARVALLTGSVDIATLEGGIADAMIPKPFSLETLTGTVSALVAAGARTPCP